MVRKLPGGIVLAGRKNLFRVVYMYAKTYDPAFYYFIPNKITESVLMDT